jgi:5,10-methylenetetrahydrofolate reductase
MSVRPPVQVSFEFFPPNDEAMEQTLWASIERLAPLYTLNRAELTYTICHVLGLRPHE